MDSTGSTLSSIIEQVRHLVREPDSDSSFDNNYLLRNIIMPAYTQVLSLLNQHSLRTPLLRFPLNIVAGTQYYQLPPCIASIVRIARFDEYDRITEDWVPRNHFSYEGPGWAVHGNTLIFRPAPTTNEVWTIQATHNGDMQMHKGTGSITSETTFTLANTPTLGILDKRPHCYVGAYLRLLSTSYTWQERLIIDYDASTREVTLLTPFDGGLGSTSTPLSCAYEIAPPGFSSMESCVAAQAAIQYGTIASISQKKMAFIGICLDNALKALVDNEGAAQIRTSKGITVDTIDSENRRWILHGGLLP